MSWRHYSYPDTRNNRIVQSVAFFILSFPFAVALGAALGKEIGIVCVLTFITYCSLFYITGATEK